MLVWLQLIAGPFVGLLLGLGSSIAQNKLLLNEWGSSICKWTLMITPEWLKTQNMSHHSYRNPRYMTAQCIETLCVLMFHQKTHPLLLWKKHLAWKITSFLRDLLQKTYCLSTAKITEKTGKTRLKSHCQPLHIKLQVGAKHRKGIKSLLKTYFHKKGDPFWTLSRKDWNSLPSFFPGKHDNNQINNKVT